MSPGVTWLPRVRGAPGILKPGSDQVVVGIRAIPVGPGVEVANQDYREGGVGRSAQYLVALSFLDCLSAILLQMRVDEPKCLAAQRHIYRTPSSHQLEMADAEGFTGWHHAHHRNGKKGAT